MVEERRESTQPPEQDNIESDILCHAVCLYAVMCEKILFAMILKPFRRIFHFSQSKSTIFPFSHPHLQSSYNQNLAKPFKSLNKKEENENIIINNSLIAKIYLINASIPMTDEVVCHHHHHQSVTTSRYRWISKARSCECWNFLGLL